MHIGAYYLQASANNTFDILLINNKNMRDSIRFILIVWDKEVYIRLI